MTFSGERKKKKTAHLLLVPLLRKTRRHYAFAFCMAKNPSLGVKSGNYKMS